MQWAQLQGYFGPPPSATVDPGLLSTVVLAALSGCIQLLADYLFTSLRAGEDVMRLSFARKVGTGGFAHLGETKGEILGDPSVNRRAGRFYTQLDSQHDMRR